jgi:hypothetical protein
MLHIADHRGRGSALAPAAFLLLALCLLAAGVQAEPTAGAVPITNSTVITAPGTYYLAQSLPDLDGPVAISIRSPDVAFDGQDRLIDGRDLAGSIGIEVRPPDGGPAPTNVSVTNVRLADWATGLDASAAGIRLVNVEAESGGTGFRLLGPGAAALEGCTAEENEEYGVRADGISGDLALALSDVVIHASGNTGLDARLAAVTMTDCLVWENGRVTAESSGFRLYKGSATVRDSTFSQNLGTGIFLDTSTSGTISGSLIKYNEGAGIRDAETPGEAGSVSIYDNLILNNRNVELGGRAIAWSVPKTAGPNVVDGPFVGGNCWMTPNGTGFSQTHRDTDGDGFCDEAYVIADGATDALPLAILDDTPTPRPTSAPYRPHTVADRIQAEDYDTGGENVAYHDTTPGNEGGAYRHDDVDIETGNGITDVGWIRDGEYLVYTVNVAETGDYAVAARVATPNTGCRIRFSVDGQEGTVLSLPKTGSFETYATATRVYYTWSPHYPLDPSVTATPTPQATGWGPSEHPLRLTAGTHVIKLEFNGDGQNLDWFELSPYIEPTTPPTPSGPGPYTPLAIPGTIQAEDYNTGGEGIAYHDTTGTNEGGAYRHDGVDIETAGGVTNVGWIRNGEWMTYTADVAEAGNYTLTARVASPNSGRAAYLSVDGAHVATIVVPNTGSFDAYRNVSPYLYVGGAEPTPTPTPVATPVEVSAPVALSAGTHVLKLEFSGDGQNLDWIAFAPVGVPTPTPTPTVMSALPGTIQAEDYDLGGEGVAYHDTTAGNTGGAYRTDDVDVAAIAGGHAVVGIEDGEYLTYTIGGVSATPELPALVLYLGSDRDGGSVQLEVNGRVAGNVSVPNTGSPTAFTAVQTQVVAAAGTLRLRFHGAGMGMDRIESPRFVSYADAYSQPNFTADRTNGTAPLTVRFTDASSAWAYEWHWDFGDGATSTERNPVHTFQHPGVYGVSLAIMESDRWSGGTILHIWNSPYYTKVVQVTVEGTGTVPGLAIPGTIQAEDYDAGGEGVAYHDTTAGNEGGAYRTDDVDIETANGVTNVGWVRTGEYLAYTADVRDAGAYTLSARVASPNSGRTIAVSVDGAAAATIAVPRTGSFEAFRTVDVPVTLAAGTHTLKLAFGGDGQNLDWIAFAKGGEVETPTPEAGGANFTAAPLSAPRGSAVKFTLSPAAGKTVASAWWSFDAPAHLNAWNSRATSPTFFYPAAGSFSPLVKIAYTDGSTETVQRTNYVRAT